MLVDTAALTGEPIPRKVPRPDRPEEPSGAGRMLLSGCIVKLLGLQAAWKGGKTETNKRKMENRPVRNFQLLEAIEF